MKIGIAGLGLMGGSLGRALVKKRNTLCTRSTATPKRC